MTDVIHTGFLGTRDTAVSGFLFLKSEGRDSISNLGMLSKDRMAFFNTKIKFCICIFVLKFVFFSIQK